MTERLAHLDDRQRVGTYLLEQLDTLCRRHDIRFFLSGGTLLGAYRGGGWIPWDDDVDVVMDRESYDRLLAVAHELPDAVELADPLRFPGHASTTSYLRFLPSSVHYEGPLDIRPAERDRLCLDLMVLDRAPESALLRDAWLAVTRILMATVAIRATTPRRILGSTRDSVPMRLLALGVWTCSRLLPWATQKTLLHRCSTGFNRRSTAARRSLTEGTRFRRLPLPDEWFDGFWVRFEGRAYRATDPEAYLTAMYGPGFRQPPPPAERRPSHYDTAEILPGAAAVLAGPGAEASCRS